MAVVIKRPSTGLNRGTIAFAILGAIASLALLLWYLDLEASPALAQVSFPRLNVSLIPGKVRRSDRNSIFSS